MGLLKIFKSGAHTSSSSYSPALLDVLPDNPKAWYCTRHLLLLNLLLLVPLFSSSAIGFDGAMMNGLQSLPQWRQAFGKPTGALLGFMNAVYPVGKVLGLFPATWLGDRYGRKFPLCVGFVLLPIGAALQGAAQNTSMFIVSRFFIGFSTSFIAQPSPVLITELAYPTHRGKLTALYNTCYYAGAVLAAWSTYGTFRLQSTWAWRIPSLLQAAFPFVQAMFLFWVPESPRWLIAHGKHEVARAIFTRYHAGGDENSLLVKFEVDEITEAIRLDQNKENSISYFELLRNAPNRRRSLITFLLAFFTQWNGCSVVSYYLTLVLNTIGITEASTQTLINGMLQIYNWIAAVFGGALLVDRAGRRTLFLVATTGMLLSYIPWTVLNAEFAFSHNQALGNAVLAFIFIYYFFYDIAWTPLPVAYATEIFPFSLRGRGVTLYYFGTYAGLITAQFLNPIAMENLGWKYYIVFCVVLFFLVIGIYLWVPETRGRTLEEIAEIFDGPSNALSTAVANYDGKNGDVDEVELATCNSY